MTLGEKLKYYREQRGLSQPDVAKRLKVTTRTIQFYEKDERKPNNERLLDIAEYLAVPPEKLLTANDSITEDSLIREGNADADVTRLIKEAGTLFAGGRLSDADKDAALRALIDAYWDAKKVNKKYTPRKYRKKEVN